MRCINDGLSIRVVLGILHLYLFISFFFSRSWIIVKTRYYVCRYHTFELSMKKALCHSRCQHTFIELHDASKLEKAIFC